MKKITCNTSSAYRVQHVVCHVVRRDSSALKFDRVEITIISTAFYWPKPISDEGGEETGASGENPRRRASENTTYQNSTIQAPTETRTGTLALWQARESDMPHTKADNNSDNIDDSAKRRNSQFVTLSSLRRELSQTRTLMWTGRNREQITCNTSDVYHVQHVVCHAVRRDN